MFEEKFRVHGCKVFHVPRFRENVVKNIIMTKKIIEREQYDLIHVHHTDKSFIQLFAAMIAGNNRRIAHSHDSIIKLPLMKDLIHKLSSLLTRKFSNYYFACSIEAAKWVFGEKNAGEGTVKIINNGIVPAKFLFNSNIRDKTRKSLGIDNKFVIGHVGRFTLQKNHDFLIDVFKSFHEVNQESCLILIGEGELKEQIKQKVENLKLKDSIIFLDASFNIADFMNAFDLFVLPSIHEGLGIVLIEAQASGLKCIATEEFVPRSAKISDLLKYQTLDKNKWVESIVESSKRYERKDMSSIVQLAGYDIKNIAKELEEFYYSI